MNKENCAVLELLKFEYDSSTVELLKRDDINWITVLGYLTYHRVAGLVYDKVNNLDIRLLDYQFFLATYMINQAQKLRNSEQSKYVEIISKVLIDNKIEHAFLKGSAMSNTIYNYGSRASNDIDILINKKFINKVTALLQQLGFKQGKYDYKNNNIVPFSKEEINKFISTRGEIAPFVMISDSIAAKTIDVDVNFSLDWTPDMNEEVIDTFLAGGTKNRVNENAYIWTLSLEHNFLELCIHLYKDSALIDIIKKRKILDLYKFVDIYYFLKVKINEMKFDLLYNEICKFGLDQYVYFSLSYIYQLFPDVKCYKVDQLLNMLDCSETTLYKIFDQYNENYVMSTSLDIEERVFSYDVIKKYN